MSNNTKIERQVVVRRHNPSRHASSLTSPMQVGNGSFAFGVDITGLQTFAPFSTMTEWGWKNDPLPLGQNPADYRGVTWRSNGRDVRYDMPNEQRDLSEWLISNPNRMNLARIGLLFENSKVTENDLVGCTQTLDLWTGAIMSSFEWEGHKVYVETTVYPDLDAIGIKIESLLISAGKLSLFIDFPYNSGSRKFSGPYVGDFTRPTDHTTTMAQQTSHTGYIHHCLDDTSYYVSLQWNMTGTINHLCDHRYRVYPSGASSSFEVSVIFSQELADIPDLSVIAASQTYWPLFWNDGGIIDLSESSDPRWFELERRIILSQYVMAVNCTGYYPPQESGLVNLGWYGKFHMEMYFWHVGHLALFNKWSLLNRSISVYERFLPGARSLALSQGFKGARWPKMTDPSGKMAPGEINSLLIWQQPHPMIFAELDYRAHPTHATLEKWKDVVFATAEFMATYAMWNEMSRAYNLGPPLHIMSENTDPKVTYNPSFELEYWKYGLSVALAWRQRLGLQPETEWCAVVENIAPLPVQDGLYVIWPRVENMWEKYNWEHPSLAGIYGLLPGLGLDKSIMLATTQKIWATWRFDKCWGWDFGMLAMNAARSGNPEKAVEFLLHENLVVDDAGLVLGTEQVPFPYFPANGSLLYAIAFMVAGWDGVEGNNRKAPGFPEKDWVVKFEDLSRAI